MRAPVPGIFSCFSRPVQVSRLIHETIGPEAILSSLHSLFQELEGQRELSGSANLNLGILEHIAKTWSRAVLPNTSNSRYCSRHDSCRQKISKLAVPSILKLTDKSRGPYRVRIVNAVMNNTGSLRYHHSSGTSSIRSTSRDDLMPEPATPSLPRPSASLIVLDDQHRVLLVQRTKNATSFGGMHVFPGGNFDKRQDDSAEMTAIRETFEETGVLIASPAVHGSIAPISLTPASLAAARAEIHSGQLLFVEFLQRHGLRADVGSLMPFTQWVTPPQVPRRFHTHFFVTFLPTALTSQAQAPPQPTSDGGVEITSAVFLNPLDILKTYEDDRSADKILLMPPQFYLISTLAAAMSQRNYSAFTSFSVIDERSLIEQLAYGEFGSMIINPRGLIQRNTRPSSMEGQRPVMCLTYEGDETRGGPKGRYHRSYIEYTSAGVLGNGKGGVPRHITLVRNFDILKDRIIPDISEDGSPKARM